MKLLIALFLITIPGLLIAQKSYEPIDKIGWELPDFTELQGFEQSDLGSVTYLIVLNKSGQIKKVRTLSNTLNDQTELKVRNQLSGLTLAKKKPWDGHLGYKGRLQIDMGSCIDDRASKVQQ